MEEKELTQKQKQWLEKSAKIGLGPMTKSERQALEDLYNDMKPEEQKELAKYIEEKFGYEVDESPIKAQEEKTYPPSSQALMSKLSGAQSPKPPIQKKNNDQ